MIQEDMIRALRTDIHSKMLISTVEDWGPMPISAKEAYLEILRAQINIIDYILEQ